MIGTPLIHANETVAWNEAAGYDVALWWYEAALTSGDGRKDPEGFFQDGRFVLEAIDVGKSDLFFFAECLSDFIDQFLIYGRIL